MTEFRQGPQGPNDEEREEVLNYFAVIIDWVKRRKQRAEEEGRGFPETPNIDELANDLAKRQSGKSRPTSKD
jgi:hypothetical protein